MSATILNKLSSKDQVAPNLEKPGVGFYKAVLVNGFQGYGTFRISQNGAF